MKILLVEDDLMIGETIERALRDDVAVVDWVRDGNSADTTLRVNGYDAILLDLSLPGMDGLAVLRALRARRDATPVLVITARDRVPDRIKGLEDGADDYLVKPFDLDELIARLHALVRRARGRIDHLYQSGATVLNPITREATQHGVEIVISAREWAVLDALIARPGAILSRSQLESRLYGWNSEIESNAVEVYIHSLRKKLGQDFILNVRGVGYMVGRPQ